MNTRREMMDAAIAAGEAVEHLEGPYALLALAHAVAATIVAKIAPEHRADTLRTLCDGPLRRALRDYETAEQQLSGADTGATVLHLPRARP